MCWMCGPLFAGKRRRQAWVAREPPTLKHDLNLCLMCFPMPMPGPSKSLHSIASLPLALCLTWLLASTCPQNPGRPSGFLHHQLLGPCNQRVPPQAWQRCAGDHLRRAGGKGRCSSLGRLSTCWFVSGVRVVRCHDANFQQELPWLLLACPGMYDE